MITFTTWRRRCVAFVAVLSLALAVMAGGAAPVSVAGPTWTMMDLGTLGGWESEASGVSGSLVVGSSITSDSLQHAFVYDLDDYDPDNPAVGMRDLGTLGGDHSDAYGVDAYGVSGGRVVGSSDTLDGYRHAFVYDLNSYDPADPAAGMRDLGTLTGGMSSLAKAVSGDVAVGCSEDADGFSHAVAFDLSFSPPS